MLTLRKTSKRKIQLNNNMYKCNSIRAALIALKRIK